MFTDFHTDSRSGGNRKTAANIAHSNRSLGGVVHKSVSAHLSRPGPRICDESARNCQLLVQPSQDNALKRGRSRGCRSSRRARLWQHRARSWKGADAPTHPITKQTPETIFNPERDRTSCCVAWQMVRNKISTWCLSPLVAPL